MRLPNVDTFGDLVDRLIVEVNKISVLERRKRDEHEKPHPDIALIASCDNASRDANEFRSILKNKINECLSEIVASGEYKVLREVRTFRPPTTRLADLLADACRSYADTFANAIAEELLP